MSSISLNVLCIGVLLIQNSFSIKRLKTRIFSVFPFNSGGIFNNLVEDVRGGAWRQGPTTRGDVVVKRLRTTGLTGVENITALDGG